MEKSKQRHITPGTEEFNLLVAKAASLVIAKQTCNQTMLQKEFKIGYNMAGAIIDQLERQGLIHRNQQTVVINNKQNDQQ